MIPPFIPTTRAEMTARGWEELDILFVSGDAYVDHPAFGVALLARLLESAGYRVGIVAQPDWRNAEAFRSMGRPRLFAAVSAGAMDSMVNHYTAAKKRRNDDAYTPGGRIGLRPNRAVIAYTAAIKGAFRGLPVIVGGIEASLRRLAHYDYWDNAVRRSVLVDSKADLLLYGMAETALLEVARRAAAGEAPAGMTDIRGTARIAEQPPANAVLLPSFEEVSAQTAAFAAAYVATEQESNPYGGRPLAQRHDRRWVVTQPPALPLTVEELDRLYALPYTRLPHPSYSEKIPAFEQIRHSITTHRGCYGGCAFCALGSHQGKIIQSRSVESILTEIDRLVAHAGFRGTISDLGGPSANMYGTSCSSPEAARSCRRPSCLQPRRCPRLDAQDRTACRLLDAAAKRPGVRHLFVASGVRFDLLEYQPDYFRHLLARHVSGLLKVAPEAFSNETLRLMRKPESGVFVNFLDAFRDESRRLMKRQSIVPYLMAGHPGTTLDDMVDAALLLKRLHLHVEQVQEFTPTPATLSTCIWHTGIEPYTGAPVYVPRDPHERQLQKALLLWHLPENQTLIKEALRRCGRLGEAGRLLADALPMEGKRYSGFKRRS